MKYELEFQEIIQQKGILKLVHVTRKDNLKSILKHGILPREELSNNKIKFIYNDQQRLDNWLNAVCVSVTKLNPHLIDKFSHVYKLKKKDWFQIHIKPSILTQISAIFCETNAASSIYNKFRNSSKNKSLKTPEAFLRMFNKSTLNSRGIFLRKNKKSNETTDNQAEVCILGKISTDYFLNIKSIERTIDGN